MPVLVSIRQGIQAESSLSMMERMREGASGVAVKVILGVIILSFVFTGVSGYIGSGASSSAAKVGNDEISRGDFEREYQNQRNQMQAQLGDYFSNLLADQNYVNTFRKSVLDRMIDDKLIERHAESLGLRVSDAQVRQQIFEFPQFQVEGKFDEDVYQATLRRAGFTAHTFSEDLRKNILREQLRNAIEGTDFSLAGEVESQSKLISQTRDVKKITLSLSDFAEKVKLSDEEINDYYQQHTSQYTRPEQMKVAYIELSAEKLKNDIVVSDSDAKAYYQDNIDKYTSEEQRRVSHILIQGDNKEKAQKVLDKLKAGADFATLAKEDSEDVGSAEEGGSLGWIERDVMDPEFEKAAFALKQPGETTDLVKSEFGYHIIKLDELKAPETESYETVAKAIKQELKDQKAADEFYALQAQLETQAYESPDSLDAAAEAIKANIQTTDFISDANAPDLLKSAPVLQALANPEVKEDGLNSEVIEIAPEHVVVVRINDTRPEKLLPLSEVRDDVVEAATEVKAKESAEKLAISIVEELKSGKVDLLQKYGLKFGEAESLDRSSPIANVVFAMAKPTDGKVEYTQLRDLNGDFLIVGLTQVVSEPNKQYEEQIKAQLTRTNAQQDFTGLIKILRNETDIQYYVVTQ